MYGFKGSDLYFSKINLVFGDSWITVERLLSLSPLRLHAVGDGEFEKVMTSQIWESVVKSLDTRGHLHLTNDWFKRFLVCILVRLPARWLMAETEAKKPLPSYAQGVLLFYFVPLLFSRT